MTTTQTVGSRAASAPEPVTVQADIDIREPIIISVSEFNKVMRLDIRHYYIDTAGEPKPSKKGINIPFAETQHLLEALVEAINSDKSGNLYEQFVLAKRGDLTEDLSTTGEDQLDDDSDHDD